MRPGDEDGALEEALWGGRRGWQVSWVSRAVQPRGQGALEPET